MHKTKRFWTSFGLVAVLVSTLRIVIADFDCTTTEHIGCVHLSVAGQGGGASGCGGENVELPTINVTGTCPIQGNAYGIAPASWTCTDGVITYPAQGAELIIKGAEDITTPIGCGSYEFTIMPPDESGPITIEAKVSGICLTCTVPGGPSTCPSGCSTTTFTRTVKATVYWRLEPDQEEGANHLPSQASSCGTCGSGSGSAPGTPTFRTTGGPNFELNLGRATADNDAGFLGFSGRVPSTALATPASLIAPMTMPEVEVLRTSGGSIRQIKSPQMLVNVQTISAYEYRMQCFSYGPNDLLTKQTDGYYSTSGLGEPFTTWIVKNPDGASSINRLHITEQRGSTTRSFEYTYTSLNHRWDILQPDGSLVSNWDERQNDTLTNYVRQVTAAGSLVQKQQLFYEYRSARQDKVLVQRVNGAGDAVKTTSYQYYPVDTSYGGNAGRLKRVDHPDGQWTYYTYDSVGRALKEYSNYANNAAPASNWDPSQGTSFCTVKEYAYVLDYDTDGIIDEGLVEGWTPRRIVTKVPGPSGLVVVGKTYCHVESESFQETQECLNPVDPALTGGAQWGTEGNLRTTESFDASNGRKWPHSVTRPDGITTLYTRNPGETIVSTGLSDAPFALPSSIIHGTRNSQQVDGLGLPTVNETRSLEYFVPGPVLSREVYTYEENGTLIDPLKLSYNVTDLANRTTKYRSDCCGLSYTIAPDGVKTYMVKDSLKRSLGTKQVVDVIEGQERIIEVTNTIDVVGRRLITKRVGTDGSVITQEQAVYDVLGRTMRHTNALLGVTITTNVFDTGTGLTITTNTYPDGGTRIEMLNRDGRLAKVIGTAVFPVRYEYGVEARTVGGTTVYSRYSKEIKLKTDYTDSGEWTKTYTDAAGQAFKTVYAPRAGVDDANNPPNHQRFYNALGQLWKEIDPDGVATLYTYDDQGRKEFTVQALSASILALSYDDLRTQLSDNTLDAAAGRITRQVRSVLAAEGTRPDVVRVDSYVWLDGQTAGTLVRRTERSTDGLWSAVTVFNGSQEVTSTATQVYGTDGITRSEITSAPDNSSVETTYRRGRMISTVQKASPTGPQLGAQTFGYDSHGRQNSTTDPATGTTTYAFNNADQPASITTPNPGTLGGAPLVTHTYYDNMSRATNVVQPDGTTVTSEFYRNGLLKRTYGSRTYPVAYAYDYAGRMSRMTNWASFASSYNLRVTSWNYDPSRGWLASKDYPNATSGLPPATIGTTGPQYTYTAGGRLKTRNWLRTTGSTRIATTYKYGFDDAIANNQHGDLVEVSYNDGTPTVTRVYDRLGQPKTVTSDGTTTTLYYDLAGNLLKESYGGGLMAGIWVTNGYDHLLRRTNATAWYGPDGGLNWSQYTYEPGNRLHSASERLSLTSEGVVATYGYVANSPLVGQVAFVNGSAQVTTTKRYDKLNRLTSTSTGTGSSVVSFAYDYNNANQRNRVTTEDGSYWLYEYDALGQVIGGYKYWADGTPVSGQQFGYAFDDIGNRNTTKVNGRQTTYSANRLNQYLTRSTPRAVDVIGVALGNSTVTVTSPNAANNATAPYRRGEYFHKTLTYANSASLWESITTTATGETPKSGYQYLPPIGESFTYDLDGNLRTDNRWTYTWDAENRLVRMVANNYTSLNGGLPKCVEYKYDWQGRRISKVSWNAWDGSQGSSQVQNIRYVYDEWNLLAEVAGANGNVIRRYLWGTDLSGSMQGAGGVGGLLAVRDSSGAHVVGYDGNGNVAALFGSSGESARYEYGPFGEVIRATGPMAKANPFRFSTKYQDDESDLLYYGVRYLKTSTGGWLSRDPIGEKGGLNLYGFVRNDPISLFDKLGQNIGIPTCGYGCVPPPTCASPDSTDCGIFADLLNRWRTGYSGLYEIPDDAMGRMMERGQNKTDIEQMKNLLRARCKQFNKRPSNGAMDQIVHDSSTSAGAECEAWYLGGHTRVVSGFGDCCSGKAQICLEVTDKFDFDEQDPWPSGGMQDKIKYLGSICTGAILNFPYPTWSYANIPVHGKKCIQVRL